MSDFREEYEKKYGPMRAARKEISPALYETLVQLCQRNCWIKKHGLAFMDDPCLELDSPYTFYEYESTAATNGGRVGTTMKPGLISPLKVSK